MKKVLILDTSILCVYLEVPGKETCGSEGDRWDKKRVDLFLQAAKENYTFVLPLAAIVETGNHIAQANSKRYETAQALAKIMEAVADEQSPWAAFTEQAKLWDAGGLKQLAADFPSLATQGVSIADATIKAVSEFYAEFGWEVEILTGDKGLKAYQPAKPITPPLQPRRRRK